MTADTLFQISGSIAGLGWIILLLASPFWHRFDRFLIGVVITLLCLVYAWLIGQSFSPSDFSSFGSLDGVMKLFDNKILVAAGWVHYLAFDLLSGIWIKKNSFKYGISHWIMIPCFLLVFMMGPAGLLLYLLIRGIYAREYFAENY